VLEGCWCTQPLLGKLQGSVSVAGAARGSNSHMTGDTGSTPAAAANRKHTHTHTC
jgi:hypothetical protein